MASSLPVEAQIPQDHSHKQLLFDLPSPALTVAWSPPSSLLHQSLLAVGHAQGLSLYRQLSQHEQDLDSSSHILDRAEAFRLRYRSLRELGLIGGEDGVLSIFVMGR